MSKPLAVALCVWRNSPTMNTYRLVQCEARTARAEDPHRKSISAESSGLACSRVALSGGSILPRRRIASALGVWWFPNTKYETTELCIWLDNRLDEAVGGLLGRRGPVPTQAARMGGWQEIVAKPWLTCFWAQGTDGVHVNSSNRFGRPALWFAIKGQPRELQTLLRSHGAAF